MSVSTTRSRPLLITLSCLVLPTGCGASTTGDGAARARQTASAQSLASAASSSAGVSLSVPAANRRGSFTTSHTLRVPRGWTVAVGVLKASDQRLRRSERAAARVPGHPQHRWARAVDAVPGPDGALYVSDDSAGAIYRVVP